MVGKNLKKELEARRFLQRIHEKMANEEKMKKFKNLDEPGRLQKYIKSNKEVSEIEAYERKLQVQSRNTKRILYTNSQNQNSPYRTMCASQTNFHSSQIPTNSRETSQKLRQADSDLNLSPAPEIKLKLTHELNEEDQGRDGPKEIFGQNKKHAKEKKHGIWISDNKISFKVNDKPVKSFSILSLQLTKLKNSIKAQEKEIEMKNCQISKLEKKSSRFTDDYKLNIENLEEEVNIARAKIYFIEQYQDFSSDPEKLENFMRNFDGLIKPEDTHLTNKDLYMESGSNIGHILQEKHSEIRRLDEELDQIQEILKAGPEKDPFLVQELSKRLDKEYETTQAKFQRKKEKKVKDLKFIWDRELESLKSKLQDLSEKVAVSHLKAHK